MKKTLLLLCMAIGTMNADVFAQSNSSSKNYLSVGSGLNYNTGMVGLQYERKLNDHFSAYGGVGFGTWGTKFSAGSRYYLHADDNLGSAFSLSYSYIGGASNLKYNMSVYQGIEEKVKEVIIDAKPVSTINASWIKYWRMGNRFRFNIELGYSFLLNRNFDSNYTVKNSVKLTDDSKNNFRTLQPGGITAGFGFSFGL